jgi:hypothetical protein
VLREFSGVLREMYGVLREMYGVLREIYGVLREIYGVLREIYGVLREMLGIERNEITGDLGKLHIEGLQDLYCSLDIVWLMKFKSIIRKEKFIWNLFGNLERKRPSRKQTIDVKLT